MLLTRFAEELRRALALLWAWRPAVAASTLVGADGEVGVEEDSHKTSYGIPSRATMLDNHSRTGAVNLQERRFRV